VQIGLARGISDSESNDVVLRDVIISMESNSKQARLKQSVFEIADLFVEKLVGLFLASMFKAFYLSTRYKSVPLLCEASHCQ
jgi:hypothetical protein